MHWKPYGMNANQPITATISSIKFIYYLYHPTD